MSGRSGRQPTETAQKASFRLHAVCALLAGGTAHRYAIGEADVEAVARLFRGTPAESNVCEVRREEGDYRVQVELARPYRELLSDEDLAGVLGRWVELCCGGDEDLAADVAEELASTLRSATNEGVRLQQLGRLSEAALERGVLPRRVSSRFGRRCRQRCR